jgi:hypothetical protein
MKNLSSIRTKRKGDLASINPRQVFNKGQKIVYRQRAKANFTRFHQYTVLNITKSNHIVVQNDLGRFQTVNPNAFVSIQKDRERKVRLFLKLERMGLIEG